MLYFSQSCCDKCEAKPQPQPKQLALLDEEYWNPPRQGREQGDMLEALVAAIIALPPEEPAPSRVPLSS